jgi:hypothetical protein
MTAKRAIFFSLASVGAMTVGDLTADLLVRGLIERRTIARRYTPCDGGDRKN